MDDLDPLSPPDRRKHGYAELEQHIENHKEEVTHDLMVYKELIKKELEDFFTEIRQLLRRFFSRALIAFAIIGLTSAIGILGFGLVLKKQSTLTKDIQQQRYDVSFETCDEQNKRHDKTISKLDLVLARARKRATPEQKKQFAASRASTILLIDALQPKVLDCAAQARSRVKGPR